VSGDPSALWLEAHAACNANRDDMWDWLEAKYLALLAEVERLSGLVAAQVEVLRSIVGESYSLLTQAESSTQLRGPTARRIYDTATAALAGLREVGEPSD
jgi:ABC-type taurine transport system substrate-binding protein